MACFLVPTAEAVAVTAIKASIKKSVKAQNISAATAEKKLALVQKLTWLTNLLWGGALLLGFEHLWHGEIAPWFPFLTAAAQGSDAVGDMLHEMATVGVGMAALVTLVWGVGVYAVSKLRKPTQVTA